MAYNNVKVKARQFTTTNQQTKDLGTVSEVPMGEWNTQTQYKKLNTVRSHNATYIAKKDNAGVEPTITQGWREVWQVVAYDGGTLPDGTYPEVNAGKALYGNMNLFLNGNFRLNHNGKESYTNATNQAINTVDHWRMSFGGATLTLLPGGGVKIANANNNTTPINFQQIISPQQIQIAGDYAVRFKVDDVTKVQQVFASYINASGTTKYFVQVSHTIDVDKGYYTNILRIPEETVEELQTATSITIGIQVKKEATYMEIYFAKLEAGSISTAPDSISASVNTAIQAEYAETYGQEVRIASSGEGYIEFGSLNELANWQTAMVRLDFAEYNRANYSDGVCGVAFIINRNENANTVTVYHLYGYQALLNKIYVSYDPSGTTNVMKLYFHASGNLDCMYIKRFYAESRNPSGPEIQIAQGETLSALPSDKTNATMLSAMTLNSINATTTGTAGQVLLSGGGSNPSNWGSIITQNGVNKNKLNFTLTGTTLTITTS